MQKNIEILPRLRNIMSPYLTPDQWNADELMIISDLKITGTDYFDLVEDIEREFEVDLSSFLIGENPSFASTGLAGWLTGKSKIPIYRDWSIKEMNTFLSSKNYGDSNRIS